MSSYRLMFPGVRSSLVFSGFGLKAQRLKHLPAMRDIWVRSLGLEDPLEKEMATHSSILAWEIPWTEEPCGLQSMGLQRVGHDWATSLSFFLSFFLSPASGFQSYSYSSLKFSPSPFKNNGLPFWMPDVLCHHSKVVLWNLLSVQMFFQWICRGESGLPVLFFCHLRTTPYYGFS